jgi:hypothetical protein
MSRNRLGMKSHARRNDLVRSRLEAASRHWARMTGHPSAASHGLACQLIGLGREANASVSGK